MESYIVSPGPVLAEFIPFLAENIPNPTDDDSRNGSVLKTIHCPFGTFIFDGDMNVSMDVFPAAGPCVVDILSITGINTKSISSFQQWDIAGESDIDCCDRLGNPRPLVPICGPFDAQFPVLSLQKLLEMDGWKGEWKDFVHRRKTPKLYCSKLIHKKRAYLQCLMIAPQLFAAGVSQIASGHIEGYYQALIKAKKDIPVILTAKE